MQNELIVGLTGFKHSGKSTAATHLENKHGFIRRNFKDALVAETKLNYPDLLQVVAHEENLTIDQLFIVKPPVIRALLQNHGTEVRRREDPDYWVHRWSPMYSNKGFAILERVVADDVRFLNEARAVKDIGGIIIRIERTDLTTGGDHKSETEQLEIVADHTITVGPGEHDRLYTALDEILALHKL
jgi:hypothetical protein